MALDLAEEYYEYDSPEWHAFNKGFNIAQSYYKWISVEDGEAFKVDKSDYPNLLLYSPEFGIAFGLYNGSWFESPMLDNDEVLLDTITHYKIPQPPQ